jgi:hypothetical protein
MNVRPRRKGIVEWLLALAVGAALVTTLTYPTVPLMSQVGRVDTGDGRYSIWNIAWVGHALLTNPAHLLNANIFSPHRGTLAYSELNLVAGVFGLPAYALTKNAFAATNSAIAIGLLLSFLCTWALVRRLTQSAGAGIVAGTIYSFSPYLLGHTAHVQLQMVFVVPLVFLALHRLVDQPTWGRSVQLGLAVALSGLACGYYGIYGGLALGLAAIFFGSRDLKYWRGLGVALVTAVIFVAPVFIAFRRARAESGGNPDIKLEQSFGHSATLLNYLESGAWAHEWWRPALGLTKPDPVFPGITALVLVLVLVGAVLLRRADGLSKRWIFGYLTIGAVALWASLGPAAHLYTVLYQFVPAVDLLRAPARFSVVVQLAVAVLAGFAVSRIGKQWWIAAALTLLVAAESGAKTPTWGWPSWTLPRINAFPQAYHQLAKMPPGVVVEFPFAYDPGNFHNHTESMLNSTVHWLPLVNGYSDVTPPDFVPMVLPINGFPDDASFEIMRARHVKYVVWDIRTYNPESRERLIARFPKYDKYLKAHVKDRNVWLYEILEYPPAAPVPAVK